MKRVGRRLNINKIAKQFSLIKKTLDKYSMFSSMDDEKPKSLEDLKFDLEPVPEPLQLQHFSFHASLYALEVRITSEDNGLCSSHTIPPTPSL